MRHIIGKLVLTACIAGPLFGDSIHLLRHAALQRLLLQPQLRSPPHSSHIRKLIKS
jgi:hypothetical protein